MNKLQVNFFWRGNDFTYLNRLCVLSHLSVGHRVVMWLSGETPESPYWINDLEHVVVNSADEILDVASFIRGGGNFKTASDLWRFHFLYEHGGLYCDTDAIAIRHFPHDSWIVTSAETDERLLSIGVLASPPRQKLFLECIKNIKSDWGNVAAFTDCYYREFGNTAPTHDKRLFYPFNWTEWPQLFQDLPIPDCYSVHLYHTMLESRCLLGGRDCYHPDTMIGRIISLFDPRAN